MSYISNNLLVGEKILYYTKLHWIIFGRSLLIFGLTVGLLLIRQWFALEAIFPRVLVNFLWLLCLWQFGCIIIRYYSSEYAITSQRVVKKLGMWQRDVWELLLERIEGIYVKQTILGRIFNYGTVVIIGVGGTKNLFAYIFRPFEFRTRLQHQLEARGSASSRSHG